MPDKQGTLTDAELKQRLEQKRKRRDDLRGERKRLNERLDELGPKIKRLAERLRKRRQQAAQAGPKKAVAWALARRGVTESPYGSNWGPGVSDWIKFTGYGGPVPWCGCFVCYAAVKIGGAKIPTRVRLGYHGYIIEDARAGKNGLRAVPVSEAQPGDIVAYDFAHIGLIVGRTTSGTVHTVEGNTSSGVTGSQNNGGGVYERRRPISDVAVIARPDY